MAQASVQKDRIPQTILGRVKKRARTAGKEFDIDLDYLNEIYDSQKLPGESFARCVYSGYPLTVNSSRDYSVSVDRVDSKVGYVRGNIQLVDKRVNVAKHTLSESRFLFLIYQSTCPLLYPQVDLNFAPRRSNFKGSGPFSGEMATALRRNAIRRGKGFNISADHLYDQFKRQDGNCALSGLGLFPENVSVDRVDNSEGYVEGNVQLVTKEMNFMRGPLSLDDFRSFLDDLYEWNFIVLPNLQKRND